MTVRRVYRLDVQIPDDRRWPWQPPDYPLSLDPDDRGWTWPARRMYLSRSGAMGAAARLRVWGATVTVNRSEPIVWEATP